MKDNKKSPQIAGVFSMPDGEEVFGNLHLNGRNTVLHLQLKHKLPPLGESSVIHGKLGDLRKVSCLECIVGSAGGGYRRDAGEYHYADIFPHFVTVGDRHFALDKPSIRAIHFTTQDITSVFDDFGAFGHVIAAPKSAIETIVRQSKYNRQIEFGDSPEIFYFSGKYEVIAVDTPIGLFRVSHRPTIRGGNSNGKFINNHMVVTLEYPEPVDFDTCIERVMSIHRFLSLAAGRRQAIKSISLDLVGESIDKHSPLELHWAFAPKRPKNEDSKPHTGDIPLDAVRRPEEFKAVLKNWLNREPGWRSARIRYAGCADKGNSYDIDRLVAAANMFDILPNDAVPSASALSPDLAEAQMKCREIFKQLPDGVERNNILDALGRMNKSSLTKKVQHRVNGVNEKLAKQFPDLDLVAKIAVKARNYFVHGNSDGFDPNKIGHLMPFLVDTLEFIFATSDLICAGWDAAAWGAKHYGYGHRFTRFRWGYAEHVARLKEALS